MTEQEFTKQIQDAVIEVNNLYVEAFGKQPYIPFEFHFDGIYATISGYGTDIDERFLFKEDTPSKSLASAKAHFEYLPPKSERDLSAYRKKVAGLIDQGRELGIDDEFVNPLADVMKSISNNLITHQKGK